jgi:transcription elongation factor Elf1
LFGINKKSKPTRTKYKFNCPHCGGENVESWQDDSIYRLIGFECAHCRKPLGRIFHQPKRKVCIIPLFECEEVKESVGD